MTQALCRSIDLIVLVQWFLETAVEDQRAEGLDLNQQAFLLWVGDHSHIECTVVVARYALKAQSYHPHPLPLDLTGADMYVHDRGQGTL